MGIITSKDTRRISFDNTIATSPALIHKPTNNIIAIDNFEKHCRYGCFLVGRKDDAIFVYNKCIRIWNGLYSGLSMCLARCKNYKNCPAIENAAPDLNTGSGFINLQDEDYDYWTHRIESLKNDHQEINQIIEDAYTKTIDDTNKLFHPPKITHDKIQKIKPCFEWRAKILQCYEKNPRQPLLCSAEVEAFSNCVSSCQLEE